MKNSSIFLSKSARNVTATTAKLVAGGAIATVSSQSLNAALVVWDNTPFALSGDASSNIPIQGYNGVLNVQTAAKISNEQKSSATLTGLSGAGIAFESANGTVDGMTAFSSSLVLANGDNYYGFSLPTGSTPLYGWLSATTVNLVGPNLPTFTLTGYAYENTGASIQVGTVPEPSAVTMALLAGSAAVWRRRRNREVTAAA
jgi:hypothetical protein